MKEKVTSYEISKRLSELGFDCDSHCGWWFNGALPMMEGGIQWRNNYTELQCLSPAPDAIKLTRNMEVDCNIKAFDCWDLLMWLESNHICDLKVGRYSEDEDLDKFNVYLREARHFACWTAGNNTPQNALGLACIKILEEKNGSN